MPALIQPTGTQIIDSLSLSSGEATYFGRWNSARIDFHIANSLVNLIGIEYDYAVELIQAAGLDESALSATNYPIATSALLYAIAYRLLDADVNSQERMGGESDLAIHRTEMRTRANNYFKMAGYKWKEMGITSKYYQSATVGFPETTFVDFQNDYIE